MGLALIDVVPGSQFLGMLPNVSQDNMFFELRAFLKSPALSTLEEESVRRTVIASNTSASVS
jgi:hypothetical protein